MPDKITDIIPELPIAAIRKLTMEDLRSHPLWVYREIAEECEDG